jgi:type VI secretion system secreted protein VgrG
MQMRNDKEIPFTLTLTDSQLCLPVLRFSGQEALNQPFRFEIEVIGLAPAMPPEQLLQRPAFLRLSQNHGINGLIHSISCEHRGTHRIGYRLVLVSYLTGLAQMLERRVFVQLSVPQILAQLLTEHAVPAASYRIELTVGHYPVRPFCIQYDESALDLLQRLCEEEGIHYHFEHQPGGHVVVFADDSQSLPQESVTIAFDTDEASSPCISALFQRHDPPPVMTTPGIRNRGQQIFVEDAANQSVPKPAPLNVSSEQRHAEQRSRRHLERQRCHYRSIQGRSDCTDLLSGHLRQVCEHPVNSFNEQWLLTEVRHHGQQPSILDPTLISRRYHNDFTALPWSTDFRPPLKQPRPNIAGYHLAKVLGSPGQPPQLDGQGRIGVSLWPSQELQTADGIWLPIALSSANGRIAPHELPCAGSEVWVSFLDSDPDRPILCLGTQRQPPPRDTHPEPESSLLLDWLLNSAER